MVTGLVQNVFLQTLFDQSQEHVTGTIDLELFMGNITIKSIDCKTLIQSKNCKFRFR